MVWGLYTAAEAIISIAVIALACNVLLNRSVGHIFRRFLQDPAMLGLTGVFLLYVCSGFFSEDTGYWLRRLRLALPYLALPIGVLSIPRLGRAQYQGLLYFFFLWALGSSLYSLALYLQDFESITAQYKVGKVLPTPVQHIRYSLMLAFAVPVGAYLARQRLYWLGGWERYLQWGGSVFLFLFLHVLAVRSGLLALYCCVAYWLLRWIFLRRKWALGLGLALGLAGGLWWSATYVPTLKNKVNYTIYSLQQFARGEKLDELSDSHRLGSVLAGLALLKQEPVTGVGLGDLRAGCEAYYQAHIPSIAGRDLLPHNQWLFVAAATGLPGLLYFLWATVFPLWQRQRWKDWLSVSFHLILFSSFLVEHTLETQFGLTLYLWFVVLMARFHSPEKG